MQNCTLCPRQCGVNRFYGETGVCRTGDEAVVASYGPHFGEESVLVGRKGSGTLFFTHCNLLCNFCQNYDISHRGAGKRKSPEALADIMMYLQSIGCHNINLVTPSHVVGHIIEALEIAAKQGLTLPVVYNSSAYDALKALQLLDGLIDIYMPDFKFWDQGIAEKICGAGDYPEVARQAIKEMHRQVGDLVVDGAGIAQRGLLLRHLVLPEELAGTQEIMQFLAQQISSDTYVNIMGQYRPGGTALENKALGKRASSREIQQAVRYAQHAGLHRIDNLYKQI